MFNLSVGDDTAGSGEAKETQRHQIRDSTTPRGGPEKHSVEQQQLKEETHLLLPEGVGTHRERRGTSHGLSTRVARGVYYRPGTSRSRAVEWEETVHQDTGLLEFTTKHLYFSGIKKNFRVRYDRIVDFEPFSDGFEIMRDAQTAKPHSFETGDEWFAYNLAVNLAQM